jgi:hypothetical protein
VTSIEHSRDRPLYTSMDSNACIDARTSDFELPIAHLTLLIPSYTINLAGPAGLERLRTVRYTSRHQPFTPWPEIVMRRESPPACSRSVEDFSSLILGRRSFAKFRDPLGSALRVDVKPRAPDSNEPVLFKEAFSYRVVWKIRPVGEADAVEDDFERVLFIREHMLDAEPKLTRRCVGRGFNIVWTRLVKASWTVSLYVQGEALSDVRRFSHVEAWVDKLFRPPVSVLDVDRPLTWPFENDVSLSSHEIGSRGDPPEDVNAGALR